ncbi:hypothetical protein CTAYLR_005892 [Chrysophaeum taylorii]|uniref:SAM domain-containing protein n=1 Tax=Chrysophaeum taylorii TaxID=2483200 RepID=A0AAD7XNP0_9STRA|nr:hypothetical protein CTAYLR_005865 [Chrysophaeum taylorii]KAJ8614312.1 hypothetical protein CTAYLR_005892 [Chrysophaeum taylorii]
MFEGSCSQPTDDAAGASCGIFGGGGGAADLGAMTLDDFLEKLDLLEYKGAFETAGVSDVSSLARLTDADLDSFNLRKLEKRKLLHHLAKARGNTDATLGALSCAT